MLAFIVLVATIVWFAYKLWTLNYNYWERKGFPCLKAKFPFGSHPGLSLMTTFQGTVSDEIHEALAPHPYGGLVVLRRPYLYMRDPEIVRHILVKDFAYFKDRWTADNVHEPNSHHMFNIAGDEWRVKRVNLGPIFSTGKVKTIFKMYESIAPDFFRVLEANEGKPMDTKSTFSRFTIDFIGSWAFGGRVNSLKDPEHFLNRLGPKMFPPMSLKIALQLSTYNVLTQYQKFGSFPYIPVDFGAAVSEAVSSALKSREESRATRIDLIDILLKMRKKGTITSEQYYTGENKISEIKLDLKESDLAAEALILFSAGFDTSSTAVSTIMWELIQNEKLQEELRDEIDNTIAEHGGITYNALQSMELLDRVVSEGLRKYAIVPFLMRVCLKDYQMPDRKDLVVEAGTRVIIPLWSLHRDPALYPDPLKFDPDRFLPGRAPPSSNYFPFGDGPRYCIGKRIGIIQVKMGLALTLSRYVLKKCSKTPSVLEFEPTMLVLTHKTPYWIEMERRTDGGCLDENGEYRVPSSKQSN